MASAFATLLVNLDRHEPVLTLPAPESAAARRALLQALGNRRAAVGPPVPPRGAPMSVRCSAASSPRPSRPGCD